MDFLKTVFGAVVLRQIPGSKGAIMHAEVKIDDSIIMLADGSPGIPAAPSHVHIYVADVDKTYTAALGAGAASVQEPVKRGDENKREAVKDASGTT